SSPPSECDFQCRLNFLQERGIWSSRISVFGRLYLCVLKYQKFGLGLAAVAGILAGAYLAAPRQEAKASVSVDSTCTAPQNPSTISSPALDTFPPTRPGVTYSSSGASLQLTKTAGVFGGSLLGVTNKILSGCAADFDGDGWTDFVGTGTGTDGNLIFYKN